MCIILDFIETKLFTLQRRFGDQRSRKKIRTNHLPSLQSGLCLPIRGFFRHWYSRWRFYSQRSRKRFSWRSHFTQMFRLKIQLFPRFNWVVQRFFAWSQKAGDGSKIQSGHDNVKVLHSMNLYVYIVRYAWNHVNLCYYLWRFRDEHASSASFMRVSCVSFTSLAWTASDDEM